MLEVVSATANQMIKLITLISVDERSKREFIFYA
jgi:hypothetical protein